MTYHKLFKKIKKLEKKNPNFNIIALNKHEVVTTEAGQIYIKDNIIKLPKIYNICKDAIDYNPLAKKILEIIGE